jgi:hypothetical protein
VERRKYKGHWEIDTVFGRGSNACIVTLLERKSGYLIIGKLQNKSTYSLNKKVIRLIMQSICLNVSKAALQTHARQDQRRKWQQQTIGLKKKYNVPIERRAPRCLI